MRVGANPYDALSAANRDFLWKTLLESNVSVSRAEGSIPRSCSRAVLGVWIPCPDSPGAMLLLRAKESCIFEAAVCLLEGGWGCRKASSPWSTRNDTVSCKRYPTEHSSS